MLEEIGDNVIPCETVGLENLVAINQMRLCVVSETFSAVGF